MDIDKLIELSEICKEGNCNNCDYKYESPCPHYVLEAVCELKDHYEAKIKSDRVAVIADVREWASKNYYMDGQCASVELIELQIKLDSMEPDKGDTDGTDFRE